MVRHPPCRPWFPILALGIAALFATMAPVRAQSNALHVLFSDNPTDPTNAKRDLLLRPNVEQPFYIFVDNPTKTEKKVVVQLLGGDPPAEIVKSDPVTVSAGKAQFVSIGKPAPKQDKPVSPAWKAVQGPPFNFQVVLLDANGKPLEKRPVSATLLLPHQYLRVVAAFNGPASRLSLRVTPKAEFSGPPCPIELVLSPNAIPGLLITDKVDGNLSDELRKDGEVELFAQNLQFRPDSPGEGLVYLTADGYKRAFIFKTTFSQQGGQPQAVRQSTLRLASAPFSRPEKYPVTIEMDDPPQADVKVEVALDRAGDGSFQSRQVFPGDRRQVLEVATDRADGGLFVRTQVQDWQNEFNLKGLSGKRQLRGRLLDAQDRPIDVYDGQGNAGDAVVSTVIIDDTPPDEIKFIDTPERLPRGKPLFARIQALDRESGIREVYFFLDKPPADGKPPRDAVAGIPSVRRDGTFTAKLTIPADRKAVDVTALVVNNVGLSKAETMPVTIFEPPPPVPAGRITGVVMEGCIAQGGIDVVLRDPKDPKGAPKATAKADARGVYVFEKVPPGAYIVTCTNANTGRTATMAVTVEVDQTAKADLSLLLP